jgi:Ni/Fe-hydrogenase 1 B-type cytochrome subunit
MNQELKPESSTLSFQETHSRAVRIWHWCSSLAIIALLCTVLIASTLLKPRNNAHKIQGVLEEKGVIVSPDQAKGVAKAIGHPIWVWHKYIGISLAVLLLFRIIAEFFEPEGQSLRSRISKGALYMRKADPKDKSGRHYLYVKFFYLLFYLMIFTMVLTGICLIYADDYAFLKNKEETIKDIHSFVMYGIMGFIVIHIAGLLRAETGQNPGITSSMINGGKKA